MKNKLFKVKLESIDPVGCVLNKNELSIEIHDENSMIQERLFIHIGECLYRIDHKGFIIERLIPKEN